MLARQDGLQIGRANIDQGKGMCLYIMHTKCFEEGFLVSKNTPDFSLKTVRKFVARFTRITLHFLGCLHPRVVNSQPFPSTGASFRFSSQFSIFLPIFPDFPCFLWLIFQNVFPSNISKNSTLFVLCHESKDVYVRSRHYIHIDGTLYENSSHQGPHPKTDPKTKSTAIGFFIELRTEVRTLGIITPCPPIQTNPDKGI